MLILGEVPPFYETKEPEFGEVINKLNDISFVVASSVEEFNQTSREGLVALNNKLAAFVANTITPIDKHIALRGAAHGETKATIGLSKKDNYRVATKLEAQTYANVNAFVTPQGAKEALDVNTAGFIASNYQQNNIFKFASFYYPDEFPITVATKVDPVRYLSNAEHAPILINADRLIYSPKSGTGIYTGQIIFSSLPAIKGAKNRLTEISGVSSGYTGRNWNPCAALTTDNLVALFKPLADKKVYNYKSSTGLPTNGNQSYLLYNNFATNAYKGLGFSVVSNADGLTINHRVFNVNNPNTDPTLVNSVTSTYLALLDRIGYATATTPFIGSHAYRWLDFVTVTAGTTVKLDTEEAGASVALCWEVADQEATLNIYVPLVVTLGSLVRKVYLTISETYVPGTLLTGGSATITMEGGRVKDSYNNELVLNSNPNFIRTNDRFNLNNPVQLPGVVLNSGMMIKALSTKYGMRVKRYDTLTTGLKDWLNKENPNVNISAAISELFAPARHSSFGVVPERIIPFNHNANQSQYFVYGLNSANGKFEWADLTWQSNSVVGTTSGDYFDIRTPDITEVNKGLGSLPSSLVIRANKSASGVAISPLAFTTENNFKGYSSFDYSNREVKLGSQVTIPFLSMLPLQNAAIEILARAALVNPGAPNGLRESQIQIYAVTPSKVLIIISDGLNYAEATVRDFAVNNGNLELEYEGTNKLVFTPVTLPNRDFTGINRASKSSDNVWMRSSDLLVSQKTNTSYDFLVTRAFGGVYGDIGFSVDNLDSTINAKFTLGKMNQARMYNGSKQIDVVEEVYPGILIPNKGIYQNISPIGGNDTVLQEVSGNTRVDPFVMVEQGWVRIPAGSQVMLGGKSYVLSKDYPVKVSTTGVNYCYLQRTGETLMAIASPVQREVLNNEVLFGVTNNGVLTVNREYLVIDGHLISSKRVGTGIPVFKDDGGIGVNTFFTTRDVS